MSNYIIPPIGLEGKFQTLSPFDNILNPNIIYKVQALETIQKLLDDDIDVRNVIYIEQNLTDDDYKSDFKENMIIATLVSEGNQFFYIPVRYFITVPEATGKVFVQKAIIINLDYIPIELDVDFVKDEIVDLINSLIGTSSNGSVEELSARYVASYEEYDVYETNRQSNITNRTTCRQLLNETLEKIEIYKIKIKSLIHKIENLTS